MVRRANRRNSWQPATTEMWLPVASRMAAVLLVSSWISSVAVMAGRGVAHGTSTGGVNAQDAWQSSGTRFRWRTLALLDDLGEQHDADDGQRLFGVILDAPLDLGTRHLGCAPCRREEPGS